MSKIVQPKPVKPYSPLWYPTNLTSDECDYDSLLTGAIMTNELLGKLDEAEKLRESQRQTHKEAYDKQQQNTAYSPLGWRKYAITRNGQLLRYPETTQPHHLNWEIKDLAVSVSYRLHYNGHQHRVRGVDMMINNFFPVGVVDSIKYKDGDPFNLSADNLEVTAGTYVRKTWKSFARACHILPAGPGEHPHRLEGFHCQHTIDDCEKEHGFYAPRFQAILDDYMNLFWKNKCQSATCVEKKPKKLYWTLDGQFIMLGTKQGDVAVLDYNKLERIKPMCGYCTNVPAFYE
jgi:hypothetical protein